MNSPKTKPGDFELDVAAYQLRRGGRSIKLERIPMELLLLLVERKGQLVARGEIIEKLWGKDVFLDADNSINTAIRKLRRVFQDDPEHPTFIQTLTGKGYRFIGPLVVVAAGESSSKASPLGVDLVIPSGRVMLAVLPFENLSSDPEQEYFSDGLTEETISYLGQMNPARMGVIARTSTMAYKHTHKNISQIGRELGVDYILESSVRREGRQVRITSQLILVKEQTHLWADTYDRDVASFLSVQIELGKAISSQVQIRLDPQTSGRARERTQDLEAYDLFLRGKYHWNQLNHRQGIKCFLQAIAKDPNYAPSYAGLADCYSTLPIAFDEPALGIFPQAMEAASRAVERDDCSADAHTSVGIVKMWMEWDWPGAEASFRRAIELNANYVNAHMYLGHLLSSIGRHREAAAEMQIARQVDPLSATLLALSGYFMYHARAYDMALDHLGNALAINPDMWIVHLFLGKVYERQGKLNQAMGAFQKAFDLLGGNTEQISLKGYVHAKLGNRAEADQAIRLLTDLSMHRYVPPYNIALVYAGLGETDNALQWLEKAYETRDVRLLFLGVKPKWDSLRGYASFQNLLQRLALPADIVSWESELPASSRA